jgi:uracil-DNA glycosylase
VILKLDRLLVIGLAPAVQGENRTGRIFTGDISGDWLLKTLFETGFANKSINLQAYQSMMD